MANRLTEAQIAEIRKRADAATAIPMAPGYEATADGRIFSVTSNWRGYGRRELVVGLNDGGYPSVRVIIAGKRKHIPVHRLIASAFLPPRPSPQHEIRHLDGNRVDNRVINLAWGTASENAQDREAHGRTARGERNGAARLTEVQVMELRQMHKAGDVSQRKLAARFGVSQRTIGRVIQGEQWNI